MAQQKKKRAAAEPGVPELCGVITSDVYTGKMLTTEEVGRRESPKDVKTSQERARYWAEKNLFVEPVLKMKRGFLDFRRKLSPANKKMKKAFDAWMKVPENKALVNEFIKSVIHEWLELDSVVSLWRSTDTTPFNIRPEDCDYGSVMGMRFLKWRHGFKEEDLKARFGPKGITPSPLELKRFQAKEVVIGSANTDEYYERYRVLTRGPSERGFAYPGLHRVFRTMSQQESMEVGEAVLAHAGRKVVRWHTFGFQTNAHSGLKQADFLWTQARHDAVTKFFKGRNGLIDATKQFDHKTEHEWIDIKLFDSKKWDTIINRMLWWSGPVGFMVMTKTLAPFLFPILQVEMEAERNALAEHLEFVLNDAMAIPGGIKISWSNRCFVDPRLGWDMTKTMMQQGPLSLTTSLEETGHDPEKEIDLKKEELAPEKSKYLFPLNDPNHGGSPALDRNGKRNGKPAGTPDEKVMPGNKEEAD